MKTRILEMLFRARGAWCIFTIALFLPGTGRSAVAQWNNTSTLNAWAGMNTNFLYTDSNGKQYWEEGVKGTQFGSTHDTFWQQAEMIDMADDAYVWAETNDPGNLTNYKNEILNLANGFRNDHGDNWSSDNYNDDLDVAIIAFARGHALTGSGIMLTDPENNFETVWGRAQAGDGGLCQNIKLGCYENSSVNWTFVIAGRILYGITGTSSYKTEADGVFAWAKNNLYISSSGGIADGKGGVASYYSYNYGYAVGAATYEGDSTVTNESTYFLMHDFNNYDTPPYNGHNILPNYGQGAADNDGGFNGITLRWTMYAHNNGYLTQLGGYLAWAQANLDDAWSYRDSQNLMWDHWTATTPDTGGSSAVYSWDCSSAMVGLFNVPAPE